MTSLLTRRVTPAEALRSGQKATIRELVSALDPRWDRCYWFHCPNCQTDPGFGEAPRAWLEEGEQVFWRCDKCDHQGTVFQLVRLVLEDARALRRLLNPDEGRWEI